MSADISLMPEDEGNSPPELSLRADPALEAAGWQRRHLVDPERARETTEMYEALGFEVIARHPTPADFGPDCKQCADAACKAYVLVYTRRKPRATDPDIGHDKA